MRSKLVQRGLGKSLTGDGAANHTQAVLPRRGRSRSREKAAQEPADEQLSSSGLHGSGCLVIPM